MKNKFRIVFLMTTIIPLTSCDNQWAWWEETNISIDKYISLNDAKAALDKSSKNYILPNSTSTKHSKKTYYKEYLGKFSTETDSDINESMNIVTVKYENNYIVENVVMDCEESFLNAKSVKSYTKDTYTHFDDSKNIVSQSFTNYGYGEKIYDLKTIDYSTDEKFEQNTSLGSSLSSTSIDWNKATYGFSKKNEVIIETMEMQKGSYTVKFNDKKLSDFITNTYRLYRLKPIEKDGEIEYLLDYSYEKIEKLVGSSISGDKTLDEPFLLEKEENTKTYNVAKNGTFDESKMPEAPQK